MCFCNVQIQSNNFNHFCGLCEKQIILRFQVQGIEYTFGESMESPHTIWKQNANPFEKPCQINSAHVELINIKLRVIKMQNCQTPRCVGFAFLFVLFFFASRKKKRPSRSHRRTFLSSESQGQRCHFLSFRLHVIASTNSIRLQFPMKLAEG